MNGRKTLAILFSGILALAGCGARVKTVTDLPTNVTMQQAKDWDTAIADLHKIADTVTTLRKTVIAARNAGAIPDDVAYTELLRGIGNVDVLELNAKNLLEKTPKAFSASEKQFLQMQMNSILDELKQVNTQGTTGIKNQQSLSTINGIISELQATANLVLNLSL